MKPTFLAIHILGILLLVGCQVNTVNLAADYKMSKKQQKALKKLSICPHYLTELTDLRQSKSLGVIAYSIIEVDTNQLLLSALEKFSISKNVPIDAPHIKVNLHKAYVNSLATSMAANIVLSVEYLTDLNHPPVKYYFRGYDVAVNWNSSSSAISLLVNKAIENSLFKIQEKLMANCSTQTKI